jgi:hypothetical protein
MLNQLAILVVFSCLLTPYKNRQLRLMQSHHSGRLLFLCPKTYQIVLLFETLPLYHFEQVFSRLFVGGSFSPTLSKGIWIPHNFEDAHDSRVAIDHFYGLF